MSDVLKELLAIKKTRLMKFVDFEKMPDKNKWFVVSTLTVNCDLLKLKVKKLEAELARYKKIAGETK